MVNDLGVLLLLTTVACFQLVLCVSPVSALTDVDPDEDREPPGVLQRWYLANPSVHTPSAALTRYLIDEGLSSIQLIALPCPRCVARWCNG